MADLEDFEGNEPEFMELEETEELDHPFLSKPIAPRARTRFIEQTALTGAQIETSKPELTPEERALEYLNNLDGSSAAKILVSREADAGNTKTQFARHTTVEERCDSFLWSKADDFDALYEFVRETFNGGLYRFQVRTGSQNGLVWRKTLSDSANFKPVAPVAASKPDNGATEQSKPTDVIKGAKQTINEHLTFMRDLKEIFGDVLGASNAPAAAPVRTREEVLISLAQASDDKETKRRCLDAIIGDDEKDEPVSFAGIISDLVMNPDKLQKPLQVIMPALAPYLSQMFAPATPVAAMPLNLQQPLPTRTHAPTATKLPTAPPPATTPAAMPPKREPVRRKLSDVLTAEQPDGETENE